MSEQVELVERLRRQVSTLVAFREPGIRAQILSTERYDAVIAAMADAVELLERGAAARTTTEGE